MPTYEYVCSKCDHTFEFKQSMSAAPLETCPKEQCRLKRWGKGRVKRAIGGGAGLIFKGSGFYITDYRSEGYKAAAKQESPTTKGSDTKSSDTKSSDTKSSDTKGADTKAGADSKPAAKSEAKPAPKTESKPASKKD
jgi:putative FmdB family regulatory protein